MYATVRPRVTYGGTAGLKVGSGQGLSRSDGPFTVDSMTCSPRPGERGGGVGGGSGEAGVRLPASLGLSPGKERIFLKRKRNKTSPPPKLCEKEERRQNKVCADFLLRTETEPEGEAHDQ